MENREFLDIVNVSVNDKVEHFICDKETKLGYYVQDLNEIQNGTLFKKGINIICKYGGKRGEYMVQLLNYMAHPFESVGKEILCSKEYSTFIAFVCDIALHNNPKLAHKECYHKDLNKYVSNLCYNYYLDEAFNVYKITGLFCIPSILKVK